jgi:probable addiction module antidote protein
MSGLPVQTVATRYDVAEHLRTPEEMAAYFEACLEEADGDAAFIAKVLGDVARADLTVKKSVSACVLTLRT